MSQDFNQKQLAAGTVLRDGQREYEIIKVLGEGSFGITYLAWMRDASAPGQPPMQVAVKEFFMHDINGRQNGVVTSSVTDGMYDKYMRKFKNEASALNRLHHDNIVGVYGCFEANNTVYYAMEFLNGGSVDDSLAANGPLPQAQVLKLAAQVASALSYLHSSNMLHLDLKPSNLMLRDADHVALIDFGLAKQFDDSGNPESSTTIGGGTPGYAPIEQQNSVELANFYGGKSSVLPVTMDIYAFGATLYKMLVGKMPPMPDEILDNDVLPPQCLYERQVSPELIQVLTKAMKPRKKDRYQSVAEMYQALEPMLQPGEQTKIWTPADIKAQAAEPEPAKTEPAQTAPSPFDAGRDAGTIVAGAKPQKPAENKPWEKPASNPNPWEKPTDKPNNPFGKTVTVDTNPGGKDKKKSNGGGGGGSKTGLMVGIVAAVVIVGGLLAYLFLGGGDDAKTNDNDGEAIAAVSEVEAPTEQIAEEVEQTEDQPTDGQEAEPAAVAEQTQPEPAEQQPASEATAQQPAATQPAAPAKTTQPAPATQPKTRSVLGGKATYDAAARTITFSAPYTLRVGDNAVSLPAGAVLKKVALHPNGNLRSCVLVLNGSEERLDALNVAL